jgi:hypothetical protein
MPPLHKALPRPDLGKLSNFSMRDGPEGIENVDESKILSTAPKQPEWDFTMWKERDAPGNQPYHCGQYKPDYNVCNPRNDLVGIAFEKQMKRPSPEEGFGRNKPAKPGSYGKSIPVDRSLYRALPGVVSTIPRVPGVDLAKQIDRPAPAKTVIYYRENDPKIMKEVTAREMETQWQDTFKVVCPRSDFAPNFKKGIRRENAIMGSRLMLSDPALLKARKGPTEPTSVERSPDGTWKPIEEIDSQLARPFVPVVDFKKQGFREHTKLCVQYPARNVNPKEAPPLFSFERTLHASESHPMLDTLSKSSTTVQDMRQSRSYQSLSDWNEFCMSTV